MKKPTLILGATTNPTRYAFEAARRLQSGGYEIVPVGIKKGLVFGKEILSRESEVGEIHTVTLYIGKKHQPEWYDYILGLKPKRIIFNPGTENAELQHLANAQGIETLNACTLVMLASHQY